MKEQRKFQVEVSKPTPEQEKEQKEILQGNMLKMKLGLAGLEDDLMSGMLPIDTIFTKVLLAEKYGKALNWMQQIMYERFIVPEQQAKQTSGIIAPGADLSMKIIK